MEVTLLQIDVIFGDPDQNYRHIEQVFKKADLKPEQLVILPELWDTGYDLARLPQIADENGVRAQKFLAYLAKNTKSIL